MPRRNSPDKNPPAFLRDTDCADRYGVHAKTIWAWVRDGTFPKPLKLAAQTTRWRLQDLENWELDLASTSRGATP